MGTNYDNDDVEIRLDDLILYLLMHWKSLLIGILVGAVVLGGYKYLKPVKITVEEKTVTDSDGQTTVTSSEISTEAEKTLKEISENLTSTRREELDRIAQQKINSLKLIEKQERYLNNSLLMQMNPNDYLINTLQYKIELPEIDAWKSWSVQEEQENLKLILKVYGEKLLTDALYETSSKELNTSARYVKELVSVSSEVITESRSAKKYELFDLFTTGTENDEKFSAKAVLTVKIRAANSRECGIIANSIKSYLEEADQDVIDETNEFSVKLLSDATSAGSASDFDNTITTKRTNVLSGVNSLLNYVMNRWSMTEDEQKYVNAKLEKYAEENPTTLPYMSAILNGEAESMIDADVEEMTETMVEASTEEATEVIVDTSTQTAVKAGDAGKTDNAKKTVTTVIKRTISMKFIAIGMFLGLFLACAFWGLKYLLATKLATPYGLTDTYAVRTMFYSDSKLKGLSQLRYRNSHVYGSEELAKVLAAEAKTALEGSDKQKSLYIIGSNLTDEDNKLIGLIKGRLEDTTVDVFSAEKAIYDPEVIETLNNAGLVVVIENMNASKRFEIEEEFKYLRTKKREVLTAVVKAV